MAISKNLQAILITLLSAAVIAGIIIILHGADSQINNENLEFIRSYGWQVEEEPEEVVRLTIPEEFDEVYEAYNGLEQSAGFDFSLHKGVKATRYSYRVLNHTASGRGLIRANVFVTKNGIAAADICSLEIGGFVRPISDTSGQIIH